MPAHRGRSRDAISNGVLPPSRFPHCVRAEKRQQRRNFTARCGACRKNSCASPRFIRQRPCLRIGQVAERNSEWERISPHDFRFETRRKRGISAGILRRVVERVAKEGLRFAAFYSAAAMPAHRGRSRDAISNGVLPPSRFPHCVRAEKRQQRRNFTARCGACRKNSCASPRFIRQRPCLRIGQVAERNSEWERISPHDFRFETRRKRGISAGILRRVMEHVAKGGLRFAAFFRQRHTGASGQFAGRNFEWGAIPSRFPHCARVEKKAQRRDFTARCGACRKRGAALRRFFMALRGQDASDLRAASE